MYAAIRQGKAKAGMAEELARRIKEGAIPIISDVPGFRAYLAPILFVIFRTEAAALMWIADQEFRAANTEAAVKRLSLFRRHSATLAT